MNGQCGLRRRFYVAIAALVPLVVGCRDRSGGNVAPGKVLATQPTESNCTDPEGLNGELQVTHCRVCGESRASGTEDPIFLDGRFELAGFATDATVYQNGWSGRYLHGDHRITAIASAIQEIKLQGRTRRWVFWGLLRDQDFDDA